MTEADLRREQIIDDIGTTNIIEDAGFLLPDGTMISMVDKPHGEWTNGHHLLIDYYNNLEVDIDDEDYDDSLYEKAVNNFLKEGNIRLVPESPGFAISCTHKLTHEQKMVLYDIIDYAKNEACKWSSEFFIDVHGRDGQASYLVYNIDKLNVQRIMKDMEQLQQKLNKGLNIDR